MDDILKYDRLHADVRNILNTERITAAVLLNDETIALGTDNGLLRIIHTDITKAITVHDRIVNHLSGTKEVIASCSDNGSVVLCSISDSFDISKILVVHFDEPLKVVCLPDNPSSHSNDHCFITGSSSGKVTYHTSNWYSQKNTVLFDGAGASVISIAWRGRYLSWADASNVRVMDFSTQTAICFVECPIFFASPLQQLQGFPCVLFWEGNSDLWIGWVDRVRHLRFETRGSRNKGGKSSFSDSFRLSLSSINDEDDIVARQLHDWTTDTLISGLCAFDADNMLILGYMPPESDSTCPSYDEPLEGDMIEVLVANRSNGAAVTVDELYLQGGLSFGGPWALSLLSSYHTHRHNQSSYSYQTTRSSPGSSLQRCDASDSRKWRVADVPGSRGGSRGLAPVTYIVSPRDVVLARVRDVSDRIDSAVCAGDLKTAAELATADKISLQYRSSSVAGAGAKTTGYTHSRLVAIYIDDLLEKAKTTAAIGFAARECGRLIGRDPALWVDWVYAFAKKRGGLKEFAPLVPVNKPRLPSTVYEFVIDTFLQSDPQALLETVRRWGLAEPRIFNRNSLLNRCEKAAKGRRISNNANYAQILDAEISEESPSSFPSHSAVSRIMNESPLPWLIEAQAFLRSLEGEREESLLCYLAASDVLAAQAEPSRLSNLSAAAGGIVITTNPGASDTYAEYESLMEKRFGHIFDTIERKNLCEVVQNRILSLVRVSREQSGQLLIRHLDQLPVASVVSQLQMQRPLLHWYLDLLFKRLPEVYNTIEYADYHIMQVALYAEFALSTQKAASSTLSTIGTAAMPSVPSPGDTASKSSDFLQFLQKSHFVPFELALKECERRNPDLFLLEISFIMGKLGRLKDSLAILLRLNQVQDAVALVEQHDQTLWTDVIQHGMRDPYFLTELLDYVGGAALNNVTQIVSKLPGKMKIPGLKGKLTRVLQHQSYRLSQAQQLKRACESDQALLLRRLHQQRRSAIKFSFSMQCMFCNRPLDAPAGDLLAPNPLTSSSSIQLTANTTLRSPVPSAEELLCDKSLLSHTHGVVISRGGLAAHSICREQAMLKYERSDQAAAATGTMVSL